ncbi:MAG: hypothetical protein COT92_03330 [Candidatus Doudnabacteria bacterium CG10_big_fil_rev_8_21_14_0_10_42_18]|uniref:Transcriptional repressor PaaX-like central Cas2-like domain-containing protein n=1 Tax=Candidatus Doudnabacteria bacterium CG10_big_fil_rev_8_21_14_0_10_42_18 TaxID=1974552 RepID=A0A2H0VA95_9BACT|nr:MAG: hypothetical protein COT92_03330 [Candidatus Doudnabacteria bacterium CG10_big_fil_rev_8_21_14_0_10_42_18]
MKRYYKNTLAAALEKQLPEKAFLLDQSQLEHIKSASQIVLALVGAAGVVAAAAIAPNILKSFKSVKAISRSLRKNNRPAEKIAKTYYYLKEKGYVNMYLKGGEITVELTGEGKKRLQKMSYEALGVPKTKLWDGKWWFVLADIPTKEHRNQADSFRRKIRMLGLYPLQRTVWVYPYDPTDAIAFVSSRLLIDRFVTVLRADRLDQNDEKTLRDYYKRIGVI